MVRHGNARRGAERGQPGDQPVDVIEAVEKAGGKVDIVATAPKAAAKPEKEAADE